MTRKTCYSYILLIYAFSIGCNGCFSSGSDTSYLEGGSEHMDYVENSGITDDNSIKIPYTLTSGNVITIPVKINGLPLEMIYDTGASSTCITLAEAQYLYQKGKISDNDVVDVQQFLTADGNVSTGLRIILREVIIDNKIILRDIEALVVQNQQAPLLLGQSVMKEFREISVDRINGVVKFFE